MCARAERKVLQVGGESEQQAEARAVCALLDVQNRRDDARRVACEAEQRRHAHAAAVEHSRLHEPLSGRPLSVLDQCVPLTLRGDALLDAQAANDGVTGSRR